MKPGPEGGLDQGDAKNVPLAEKARDTTVYVALSADRVAHPAVFRLG